MASGTALAQLIPMALAPLLTRLYSAEDYGHYAVFMLVSYTVSALASLRYELGIMLAESEQDAEALVMLCAGLAAAVTVAGAVAILAVRSLGVSIPQLDGLGRYSYLIPAMVLGQSLYQTINYWGLRKQAFREIAISRVVRAVAMGALNLAFGFSHWRGGLLVSSLAGQIAATLLLATRLRVTPGRPHHFHGVTRERVRAMSRTHRNFALYALPADLLSTLSQQFPVALFPPGPAGYFSFVQNVVNAPLSFVAGAVLDAFKERATRDYRERREFREIFVKLFRSLALLSIAPAGLLAVAGPALFALVFGEPWREAGEYARILSMMMLLKFVASPLSYSYYIVGRQREDFLLHVVIALMAGSSLSLGLHSFGSTRIALALFAAGYVGIYVIYLVRSYQFASGD